MPLYQLNSKNNGLVLSIIEADDIAGSGIPLTIGIQNSTLIPLTKTGIQNPRLSWIPLQGAKLVLLVFYSPKVRYSNTKLGSGFQVLDADFFLVELGCRIAIVSGIADSLS